MRVIRPLVARTHDEERGAVLMIVALCLLILLGMLVLTVDLGRGVAYKRQLVTGADAAALAAAQECALGNGTATARAEGMEVLESNVDLGGLSATFTMPECDAPSGLNLKTVTVVASADLDYYFAPILGFDSGDVAARAVAVWGAVANENPIPITVDQVQLNNCGIFPNDPPDDETGCMLEYPKDTLEEPRWGVLDLEFWGDPEAAPCTVSADELRDIIDAGGWPDDLDLNGDPPGTAPTMDCLDNGLSFSVWDFMEGKTLTFPVIDIQTSTGTIKPGNGGDCTGADIPDLQAAGFDCQIDTANVIAFVVLHVNDVINEGSTVVVDATFEITTGGGIPGGGVDFGDRAIRLVE